MNAPSPKSSTKQMFEILRERICLLDYPPGTILREATLAAEFGVSRTPLRAVLQRLSHGGLIESRDGVGTIVTDLSFAEIHDIYEMRLHMAALIGQLGPRPFTSEQKLAIAALERWAETLITRFDISAYWQINHNLNSLIASVIGNSALRQTWDHLYFLSARMWYKHAKQNPSGLAQSLLAEITEVNRAFQENDPVALGYIQRNYIAYGLSRLTSPQRKNQAAPVST